MPRRSSIRRLLARLVRIESAHGSSDERPEVKSHVRPPWRSAPSLEPSSPSSAAHPLLLKRVRVCAAEIANLLEHVGRASLNRADAMERLREDDALLGVLVDLLDLPEEGAAAVDAVEAMGAAADSSGDEETKTRARAVTAAAVINNHALVVYGDHIDSWASESLVQVPLRLRAAKLAAVQEAVGRTFLEHDQHRVQLQRSIEAAQSAPALRAEQSAAAARAEEAPPPALAAPATTPADGSLVIALAAQRKWRARQEKSARDAEAALRSSLVLLQGEAYAGAQSIARPLQTFLCSIRRRARDLYEQSASAGGVTIEGLTSLAARMGAAVEGVRWLEVGRVVQVVDDAGAFRHARIVVAPPPLQSAEGVEAEAVKAEAVKAEAVKAEAVVAEVAAALGGWYDVVLLEEAGSGSVETALAGSDSAQAAEAAEAVPTVDGPTRLRVPRERLYASLARPLQQQLTRKAVNAYLRRRWTEQVAERDARYGRNERALSTSAGTASAPPELDDDDGGTPSGAGTGGSANAGGCLALPPSERSDGRGAAPDPRTLEYLMLLYADAERCRERLRALGEAVAAHASTAVRPVHAPLKRERRAVSKALEEYHGDFSRLTDLARMTFECDSLDGMYDVLAALQAADGEACGEWSLVQIKDRMMAAYDGSDSFGYRHMLLKLRERATGHVAEVQVERTRSAATAPSRTRLPAAVPLESAASHACTRPHPPPSPPPPMHPPHPPPPPPPALLLRRVRTTPPRSSSPPNPPR